MQAFVMALGGLLDAFIEFSPLGAFGGWNRPWFIRDERVLGACAQEDICGEDLCATTGMTSRWVQFFHYSYRGG